MADTEPEANVEAKHLCDVCSTINFASLSDPEMKIYPLGDLRTVVSKTCPTCRLFTRGAERAWSVTSSWIGSQKRPIRSWIRNVVWAQHCSADLKHLAPDKPETFHCRILLGADWHPGHIPQTYGEALVRYTIAAIDVVENSKQYTFLSPEDRGLDKLFRRRLVKDQFDVDLLRTWKNECRENHVHTVEHRELDPKSLKNARFRVIDVEEERLIEPTEACRYVALSYVWGSWLDDHADVHAVGEHGNILTDSMPQTIKDAIEVTRLLDERYLWIDWVCIKQDDTDEKQRLIPHMGIVYQSACFTIVAATGYDANAGLPGLRPKSRPLDTATVISNKSGGDLQLALSRPSLRSIIERSRWNSRAWTFQEQVMSHNCFVFAEDEVFYSCPDNLLTCPAATDWQSIMTPFKELRFSDWREAYILETRRLRTVYESDIAWSNSWKRVPDPFVARVLGAKPLRSIQDLKFVGRADGPAYDSDNYFKYATRALGAGSDDVIFLQYAELVREYSRRRLSRGEDILNAFAGVLTKLWDGEDLTVALTYGIPLRYMELGLLWASADPKLFTRRKRSAVDDISLPSWSWVGWEGEVVYSPVAKAEPDWSQRNSRIPFFAADYSAWRFKPAWFAASKIQYLTLTRFLSFKLTSEGTLVGHIIGDTSTMRSRPTSSIKRSFPPSFKRTDALALWTDCHRIGTCNAESPRELIESHVAQIGGEMHLDSPSDLAGLHNAQACYELVAISRVDQAQPGSAFGYIAMIVKTEEEWCERVGLAYVPLTGWTKHQHRQRWILLR